MNRRILAFGLLLALALGQCGAVATSSPVPATPPTPARTVSPAPTGATPTLPSATLSPGTPPPAGADTRFGAVFFTGQINSSSLDCAELEKLGVHSTFLGAYRPMLEPNPGQYDWSSLDPAVAAALSCGVEPVVKITVASPGQPGVPPTDLGSYSGFVYAVAEHLIGKVHAYAIENEVGNGVEVWTGETYEPVLAAAHAAIHRADPTAVVLDGTLTIDTVLYYRANQLYTSGDAAGAVSMLTRFNANMMREIRNLPTTEQALTKWLATSVAQRNVGLLQALFDHPADYDAVQVHYLQDDLPDLPEFISWIKGWAPGKPFQFWEIGFGWDGRVFSEESHAAGVAEILVTCLGEGAGRVIYEPYWESQTGPVPTKSAQPGRVTGPTRQSGRGLVTPDGLRLAATAYQVMTSQLSGYQAAAPVSLGTGVSAYRFTTSRGEVYVLWAAQSTTARVTTTATTVAVTGVTGEVSTGNPAAIAVGPSPIYVAVP